MVFIAEIEPRSTAPRPISAILLPAIGTRYKMIFPDYEVEPDVRNAEGLCRASGNDHCFDHSRANHMALCFVAGRIAQQQADTARQQANTAFDQLRYGLFEKRFAIYNTARELVVLVVNERNLQGSDVVPLHAKLNEAEFFFSKDICDWLRKLREDCNQLLIMRGTPDVPNAHPSEIAAQTTRLVDVLAQMPYRFENELGFRHVSRRPQ
jgi:hypothetical protein